jgi:hypothetical protein
MNKYYCFIEIPVSYLSVSNVPLSQLAMPFAKENVSRRLFTNITQRSEFAIHLFSAIMLILLHGLVNEKCLSCTRRTCFGNAIFYYGRFALELSDTLMVYS